MKEIIFESSDVGNVTALEFSPDGRHLAVAYQHTIVGLLGTEDWKPIWRLKGHSKLVRCMALSLDSKSLASGSDDGTLRIWNIENGQSRGVVSVCLREVGGVCFSPDGEHIVSGSRDGIVRMWRTSLIGNTQQAQGAPGGEAVHSVALGGDGKRVLVVFVDEALSLWNALNGQILSEYCAPENYS